MTYGEQFKLLGLDWAYIHFVENEGMAFGITFGGSYGKLLLSIFRILAVGFLIYYIQLLLRHKVRFTLVLSFALILAGAIGNIIDSAFYGLIFSASGVHQVAEFLPATGGYGSFLHGRVVDMFYFPIYLVSGYYPDWLPFLGGSPYRFEFFKPVFNVADISITMGVLTIILFQRSFFSSHQEFEAETASPSDSKLLINEDEEEMKTIILLPNKQEKDNDNESSSNSPKNIE